jgi:hypothetical protein
MKNTKAFLLLEVILAMIIVTSGLFSVGHVYSAVKGAIDRSRLFLVSSLLLEEKMFDIQLATILREGQARGEFADSKGWLWEYRSVLLDAGNPGLFKVTLGVYLPDQKKLPDTYWLETYLKKCKTEETS